MSRHALHHAGGQRLHPVPAWCDGFLRTTTEASGRAHALVDIAVDISPAVNQPYTCRMDGQLPVAPCPVRAADATLMAAGHRHCGAAAQEGAPAERAHQPRPQAAAGRRAHWGAGAGCVCSRMGHVLMAWQHGQLSGAGMFHKRRWHPVRCRGSRSVLRLTVHVPSHAQTWRWRRDPLPASSSTPS